MTAVLIIWGPGAPTIPTGFEVDDRVVVCRGSSAKEWRAYLERLEPTIDASSVPTLVNIVRDHATNTEQANRQTAVAG